MQHTAAVQACARVLQVLTCIGVRLANRRRPNLAARVPSCEGCCNRQFYSSFSPPLKLPKGLGEPQKGRVYRFPSGTPKGIETLKPPKWLETPKGTPKRLGSIFPSATPKGSETLKPPKGLETPKGNPKRLGSIFPPKPQKGLKP